MAPRPVGGLPTIESCYRRFDRGLKNAIFAFQPPWYKFEMRCPLVRPSQTHLRRSARAPVDRGPWGFGEGVVGSDHPILAIAFQPPWYKFKMPCLLVSSTQTGLGPSARTPADCGTCGFGDGVVSSDHLTGRLALGTPSATPALGWAP